MTDEAFLEGDSKAVHVEVTSYPSTPVGPESDVAQYQGMAAKLTSHPDSPADWADYLITGPFGSVAEYVGRSQAIHVFGTHVVTPPGPIPSCDCCFETDCFSRQVIVEQTGGGEIFLVNPGAQFYDSGQLSPPQSFKFYAGCTYRVDYFVYHDPTEEAWQSDSIGGGTAEIVMGGPGFAYSLVFASATFTVGGDSSAALFMHWNALFNTPQPFHGGSSVTGRVFYLSGADPRFIDAPLCDPPDSDQGWGSTQPDGGEDCESGNCAECDDPTNPGTPLPPFTPGFMPTFRKQIGDPTTNLDPFICTLEAGAMLLDWHTRGAVSVWGGQLVPWCGKSPEDIAGASGHPGTNLDNVRQAWLHWAQTLDNRSGDTFDDMMVALSEGRGVELQGDYQYFVGAESCQPSFDGDHAIFVAPYQVGDRLLVGDPLCNGFYGRKISSLRAYAEGLGRAVYGVTTPQKILFAVSQPWTV